MKEKEFDNDDVIIKNKEMSKRNSYKNSNSNSVNKKENLYIKSFKNQRKFLEYAIIFQTSINFTFWLNDKYEGNLFDCPNKIKKVLTSFAIMFIAVTFVEDFIYILFRKDKDDKMLTKLVKYEKNIFNRFKFTYSYLFSQTNQSNLSNNENFKDSEIKSRKTILDEKDKKMIKIQSELREIEKVETELREKIKNIPIQDLSHSEILTKINQNKERKKNLISEFREYNKNLNNIQMI